jgi:hypothetical protein
MEWKLFVLSARSEKCSKLVCVCGVCVCVCVRVCVCVCAQCFGVLCFLQCHKYSSVTLMLLITALYWTITQPVVVISSRRFGTTPFMVPIGRSETSVVKYHNSLRNMP